MGECPARPLPANRLQDSHLQGKHKTAEASGMVMGVTRRRSLAPYRRKKPRNPTEKAAGSEDPAALNEALQPFPTGAL